MNQQEIASAYRQVSVTVANPAGQILKLYERIIQDLRDALEANKANKIERRVASLNHALLIIAELEGVLDFERGGQVAQHLRGFYRVARGLILQANIRATAQSIEEIIQMFLPLREAWQQVESDVARHKVDLPEQSEPALATPVAEPPRRRMIRRPMAPAESRESEAEASDASWSA
jgi:flagellar secretion chaperone FliS